MNDYRYVKLLRHGLNQVVEIPREFELAGEDAIIRREGDRLVIEAATKATLLTLLASLSPIYETFGEIDAIGRG